MAGRCVLVIEDECYLADDIVRALTGLGAQIVGPWLAFGMIGSCMEPIMQVMRATRVIAAAAYRRPPADNGPSESRSAFSTCGFL